MNVLVERDCVVEIGGIPIQLRIEDQPFLQAVLQRYQAYLSASDPEFQLAFEITGFGRVSDDDVSVRREGGDWVFARGDFQGRFDTRSGRGTVRQQPNLYALDSVLRILHSLVLAGRGGFLLHGASAIYESKAYVFSGVSGAGKTTLIRLAPPDVAILTDEISFLRPGAGGYSAWGTPFSGELAQPGENRSAPLSGLFFLEKGPENRIEELHPTEAIRRLMRNILFFADDQPLADKILASACDVISQVPVCRLVFYPDARVWDSIRQFQGAPAHA